MIAGTLAVTLTTATFASPPIQVVIVTSVQEAIIISTLMAVMLTAVAAEMPTAVTLATTDAALIVKLK